jgi:hypothetical protein
MNNPRVSHWVPITIFVVFAYPALVTWQAYDNPWGAGAVMLVYYVAGLWTIATPSS